MKKLLIAMALNITVGNLCHAMFIGSSSFFNSLRANIFADFVAGFSVTILVLLAGFFLVSEHVRHAAAAYVMILAATLAAVYLPLLVLLALAFKGTDSGIVFYARLALMFLTLDALYWVVFTQINYFLLRKKVRPAGAGGAS